MSKIIGYPREEARPLFSPSSASAGPWERQKSAADETLSSMTFEGVQGPADGWLRWFPTPMQAVLFELHLGHEVGQ
eukprot:716620-Pyramimonas_sp.AAC.1